MKKISLSFLTLTALLLLIVLTSTWYVRSKIDYKDSDIYISLVNREISEVNPSYIPLIDEYFNKVGLQWVGEDYITLSKSLVNDNVNDLSNKEAKVYYKKYKTMLQNKLQDETTIKTINSRTTLLQNRLDDDIQIKVDKANIKTTTNYVSTNKDKVARVKQKLDKIYRANMYVVNDLR